MKQPFLSDTLRLKTYMKKIICFVALQFAFLCCTPKEVEPSEITEIIPVESVVFPAVFTKNQVALISINYKLPTSCHRFVKFQYTKNVNTRTVAVETAKSKNAACNPNSSVGTETLSFKPEELGVYYFRFFKGKDANGADLYYEYYATVNN